jgi:hypothetical protein
VTRGSRPRFDALLKEREEFDAAIADKLAKLCYHANSGKKRGHHKKSAADPAGEAAKRAAKPMA